MNIDKSFCVLPFTHLATHPNGSVTPCCESKLFAKKDNKNLYLGVNTIEEIRNCKDFEKLRNDMLSGILNPSCDFCYKREEAGLESKRIRENRTYHTNNPEKKELISVELRLGNVCNAKCIICHPGSSSKWNEDINDEIINLDEGYNKNVIENTWFRSDAFYNELLKSAQSIEHFWFNGGEPLLIKEHLNFLSKLINLNLSSNITLEYHTNGSLISRKIIDIWSKFKNVKVTISVDDIEERFYYVRFPLNFKDVKEGIKLLVEHNIHYDIIPTISLLNASNIGNIYQYFIENFNKECAFNYLRFPKFQNISNLPDYYKKLLLEEVNLPDNLYSQFKYELYAEDNKGLSKALQFYSALDKQRQVNITEYLPEFIELQKYGQYSI